MAATQPTDFQALQNRLAGKNIILVQGACGTIGLNIIKSLHSKLQKGGSSNCAILAGIADFNDKTVEDIKKLGVETCNLDLNNRDMVEAVFKLNIQKLVVIPPYIPNRVELCSRFFGAAAASNKVKHYLLISAYGARTEETPFFKELNAIQNKLRSFVTSGSMMTVIECNSYYDNLMLFKNDIKQGTLSLPSGTGKWSPIWSLDVSEFIGKLLIEGSGSEDRTYVLTGPEIIGGQDYAKVLSDQLGRNINFVSMAPEDWKKKALQNGLPEMKAESLKNVYQWYSGNKAARVFNDFETVVGTKPRSVVEFIQKNKVELQ